MKKIFYIITAWALILTSCSDFLDKQPLSTLTDEGFWISESNVRLYAQNCYTDYFTGYGSGWTWGAYLLRRNFLTMILLPLTHGPKPLQLPAVLDISHMCEKSIF